MKDEGKRGWRKFHILEIDNLCPVSGNTRVVKYVQEIAIGGRMKCGF
jgi:hypothetical protein